MKQAFFQFFFRFSRHDRRNVKNTILLPLMAALMLTGMTFTARLSAQTIGFNSIGLIGMPDTVAAGDFYPVGVFIQNYSLIDSLVNDSVQIVGYIDDSMNVAPNTPFFSPVVGNVSLVPGDTQFFLIPIQFDTIAAGFHIGNNVIVVWPICTSNPTFTTQDSITVNVIVLSGVSTGPEPEIGDIKCFPVPANGPLYVTSNNRSLVIKQIVITDASGKIVAVSENPAEGIETQHWAAGIYMLNITFEDGRKSVYKIIR